jgi:hypothetical protein
MGQAYRRTACNAASGKIVREIQNTDYSSQAFSGKDLEGHSRGVGTCNPQAAQS